jgi:hypothetical protein
VFNKSKCQSKFAPIVTPARDNITTCSPLKANRRFGGTCRLHLHVQRIGRAKKPAWKQSLPPAFALVSFSANFSTLKVEATCSSETSVFFQLSTQHCISEDSTLRNHRCENLKSYKWNLSNRGELQPKFRPDLFQIQERSTTFLSFQCIVLQRIPFQGTGKFKGISFSPENLRTDKLSGSLVTTSWPVLR